MIGRYFYYRTGALRETLEETGSKAKIIMPYTMFSLPHINQIHFFYLADLLDDKLILILFLPQMNQCHRWKYGRMSRKKDMY